MKKIFSGLFLLLLVFSACEKTEVDQLDLKGTLKGNIYALDEFGYPNSENENILIQVEGSEPLISTLTDSAGVYEINDIPCGTYNLIVSKEGYTEYQIQGAQIVGGYEPLYFNYSISEKSSSTIENLSVEIVNSTDIYLKGIVNHNYINDVWQNRKARIKYFIHKVDNPSKINYLQAGSIGFDGESGSQLYAQIYIDGNQFSSGNTIYIIAYGCNYYEDAYYDILSNQYILTSFGAESNITSIIVP